MRRSFYKTAATVSLVAVPVSFLLSEISSEGAELETAAKRMVAHILSLVALFLMAGGIISGIVALFGIPRYGIKGIRNKALCGILIPSVLLAITLPQAFEERALMDRIQKKHATDEGDLATLAYQLTQDGPVMIDGRTRLESAEALPGKKLVLNYTLVTTTPADYQPGALKEILRPDLLETYKTSPRYKIFRDKQVPVLYRYKDSEGKAMEEITVGPEDLKQ